MLDLIMEFYNKYFFHSLWYINPVNEESKYDIDLPRLQKASSVLTSSYCLF